MIIRCAQGKGNGKIGRKNFTARREYAAGDAEDAEKKVGHKYKSDENAVEFQFQILNLRVISVFICLFICG